MKLRSGRRIVRRKNIYLPTEVWVDVFCYPWITRKQLAQIVHRIGNRWFTEQLQFYLHEWGKHTLRDLFFTRLGIIGSNEFPQTAMPENIKSFGSLIIYHFDNRVFNFFRRIQSLFTADTKLDIHFIPEEEMDNARTILGHLLPFVDGVHTLDTDHHMLSIVESFPPEKFNNVNVLDVQFARFLQSSIEQIMMEWLSTSSSNEPKLLRLQCFQRLIEHQIFKSIRKQFMEATKPSTFAVHFTENCDLPDFHCENAIGEQLCGVRKEPSKYQVFRHQTNAAAGDHLRQWVDVNTDKDGPYNRKQCIHLRQPTIGRGRIFAMPDLDGEEADDGKEEYDEEKPSTSKKRRIGK